MSQRASLNNFMVVALHLPAFTPEIFTLTAAGRPALVLVVIASVCGPGCGTSNWGRKSPFSCGSGKPLLCGFVRRAIDRHPEHRRIVLVAPDLDGDELAQEGAEGFGILTSDRAQVLDIDTAENAENDGGLGGRAPAVRVGRARTGCCPVMVPASSPWTSAAL